MSAFGVAATRRRLLAVAALAGAGWGLRLAWPPPAEPSVDRGGDPMTGAAAPPLSGYGPDGSPADLASLGGMLVMVNVWASWCQPCWDEMPLLIRAQKRWHDKGFRLFGLNTADLPDQAQRFLTNLGAQEMPVVCDPDRRIAHAWRVHALPESIVIGRTGIVAARRFGKADQRWLDTTVAPLL